MEKKKQMKEYTREQWIAEGERLFGSLKENFMRWRFKCPHCGNVATVAEFKDLGAKFADEATKHCIGRYTRSKGCDWAAYGLFDICTVHVDGSPVFEFAPYEEYEATDEEVAQQEEMIERKGLNDVVVAEAKGEAQ